MVKVHDIRTPKDINDSHYHQWCLSIQPENDPNDQEGWDKATELLQQVSQQETGDKAAKLPDIFEQSFEMGNILSSLNANNTTLIAAILYPFVDAELLNIETIQEQCSSKIANRIKGVATMDAIRALQSNYAESNDPGHIDNLRKMLLTMVDDVRVVLIKLAERLCILRKAVKSDSEKRILVAQEVNDVYAPLANRLGIGQLKWEMEDLAFRILKPDEYKKIAKSLAEKRGAREIYVEKVLQIIGDSLADFNVDAELQGRAKHIFSIWKKMQRKQVGFEEIYDVRAVRVLVPKIQDCYTVLGAVHGLWKHIPKEFDDYVATPKENGYRSLHTAVVGMEGKTLEIQIRTHEMHQESELGVAAHWKYKEGKAAPSDGYEAKIAWLRQLLEWQDEVTESADIVEEFRNQVLEERIYVFTPRGKLIDLPSGSTAVDFAYRVHTEVGHRCRGAKVNGRIIPLTQPIETGQRIEILTSKTGGPSRDWLSEHQGYVKSSRARSKIHQWFRHQDKDKNIAAGKQLLEKEIHKHNFRQVDYLKVARHFNFNKEEELFAGIGVGDKGLHQVTNYIRSIQEAQPPINRDTVIKRPAKVTKRSASSDILVEGVGNLLTRMAGCCKPVPGDMIAGYVTVGRGIMIHRSDCHYLLTSQKSNPEKVLSVDWSDSVNESYLIDLLIKAYDRKGLLGDVTTLMADEKVSVTSLNTHVNKKRLMVSIHIQIEVSSINALSRIMSRIERLPTIVSVQRK
ncbi:GTP diphosphokinase [Aliikangiella coralliicola]|uniref:GTP pyrophosphokinase n=1 Tax=Aliikangiella coralliicola TaxID=2592383 RepID=A0A545TSV7_9GAMM|nr:GTP diphosphokinase [Aliikangiella coralliicola]TQV80298.1 GTP diphosphokinase [Aliikangiella coralliicola]